MSGVAASDLSVCVFSGSGSSDQHEADNAAVLATAKIVAILQNEAAGGVPLITEVRHPRSVAYLDPTVTFPRWSSEPWLTTGALKKTGRWQTFRAMSQGDKFKKMLQRNGQLAQFSDCMAMGAGGGLTTSPTPTPTGPLQGSPPPARAARSHSR